MNAGKIASTVEIVEIILQGVKYVLELTEVWQQRKERDREDAEEFKASQT